MPRRVHLCRCLFHAVILNEVKDPRILRVDELQSGNNPPTRQSPLMRKDADFMARALDLAEASIGLASPNPQVGCVLVREGQVLGEGAHVYDALDHAEIVALKQAAASHLIRGATAYVTLEPCSHHGRTPPCADALIAAGIARCVVATVDPNPQVSGSGIAKLQAAGIAVTVGVEQQRARALNDAFAFSIVHNRPFVTLKAGLSADGWLAPSPTRRVPGEPFWLTGPLARAQVQHMRHASDAILTGIGTVVADDPLLSDRTGLPRRRPLQRVILDSQLRLPMTSKLVASCQQDVWVFCTESAEADKQHQLEQTGVRVTRLTGPQQVQLLAVLHHLYEAKLLSVLLEAGSALNGAFLEQDLVDRVALFCGTATLGPQSLPFASPGPTPFALEQQLRAPELRSFGDDLCVTGLLHDPWPEAALVA